MASNILSVLLSLIIFLFSFITVCQLALFLSTHDHDFFIQPSSLISEQGAALWCLGNNGLLILLFIMQHTGGKTSTLQPFILPIFQILDRAIYVFLTCIALQVIMIFWRPVNDNALWTMNTIDHHLFWWIFTTVHIFCWVIVYGGCLVMDLAEIVGIKKVYYIMKGYPDPLSLKSEELRRLYAHMRHPSFFALTIILWFHPVMRLDRLLIAVAFPLYMLFAFQIDKNDHNYHKEQLLMKKSEFHLNISN